MGFADAEWKRDEKINGVVHDISLRAFPHIKMTLGEIFEGIE